MAWSRAKAGVGFRSAVSGIGLLPMAIFAWFLFAAAPAFAAVTAGGPCPTGANYVNPSNPTGPLVTLSSLGITGCFYFSKSTGADGNAGTSESAPQAHLPGMPSYTGSITPAAGLGFILKGGDRWVASDFELVFQGNGTSSSPIYIGVDLTWPSSGWTRPIFDCQSTQCGSRAQTQLVGNYITIDNIESTGLQFVTETQKGVETYSGANDTVERCYFHGWSHSAGWGGAQDDGRGFAISANGSSFETAVLNVVDGSDTSKDMMGAVDSFRTVENNVFNYVYNGFRGHGNDIHGNLIANLVVDLGGDHANGISVFGPVADGSTTLYIYNNVNYNDSLAPGSMSIWAMSNGNYPGDTTYIYNNVLYDVGNGIEEGDHPPSTGGTFNLYNNTVQASGGFCFGNGESPQRNTLNYANNHCIISGTVCLATGVTCNNLGNNLSQTTAQADANASTHFDQYTASETYGYSPVATTNSTVGAGQNLTSSCSGSVAALCYDSTYASENSTDHTVVLRTTNARGGTWDVGAYEYSSQGQPPNPPTGLTAVVQ